MSDQTPVKPVPGRILSLSIAPGQLELMKKLRAAYPDVEIKEVDGRHLREVYVLSDGPNEKVHSEIDAIVAGIPTGVF